MVASEHPEEIKGRWRLIAMEIIDPEETAKDGYIDDYGTASDEEVESSLGYVGLSTGVTWVGKKEVEEVHQAVKYSSISYYMLKHPSLIIQGFEWNNNSQEVFNHMCNSGSQAVCNNGRRAISSYLDIDTRKHQYRLLNKTPF